MDNVDFSNEKKEIKVHLDKWLWAARFFKTRALSRAAIEKGLVSYNDEKPKPTLEIAVGGIIVVKLGRIIKKICVKNLSTRRKSTMEAMELYEEISESTAATGSPGNYRRSNQLNSNSNNNIRYLRRASNNKTRDLSNCDPLSATTDI